MSNRSLLRHRSSGARACLRHVGLKTQTWCFGDNSCPHPAALLLLTDNFQQTSGLGESSRRRGNSDAPRPGAELHDHNKYGFFKIPVEINVCLPTYQPTYLSTYPPIILPTNLSVYLPTHHPTYQPICLSTNQPTVSVYPPTYQTTYQPTLVHSYIHNHL